jgi:hypothetical protein
MMWRSFKSRGVNFILTVFSMQYNTEFDKLAFYGALDKLHKKFHYPADILMLNYK